MSELPEIKPEELYKNLYEKASTEASKYREQITSLEILATKLRDQRDGFQEESTKLSAELSDRDNLLRELRGDEVLEPDEIIE